MPPQTDRERLTHFVELIGAEPVEAKFDDDEHLIWLNLAGLQLVILPPEVGEFIYLTTLILGDEIEEETGQGIFTEKKRIPRGNRLTTLPSTVAQLTNLQRLDVTNNQLTSVPVEIAQLSNLQYLYLDNNQLTSVPVEIAQLSNLQHLYLHNNQLTSVPVEIAQLSNLQVLWLSNNQLISLPVGLAQLSSLQHLSLFNNQLTSVPAELAQLSSLQYFSLSNNQLKSVPAELAQLSSLQVLNLSTNELTSVPVELAQLTHLQELWLDNNQLTSVPVELAQLSNLQQLYLHENQLTSVPVELAQLTNLQRLYLGYNQLTSVPVELVQLTNLQRLYLGYNQLVSMPVELAQLTNLQRLYLHNNQLTNVPIELAQLTNLQMLYLDHNELTSIPVELVQLTNLQRLYLHNNQLTSVPVELAQLTNLQRLYLDHNELTSIPVELAQLINLQRLYLHNNQLTSIPVELAQLTNLQHLYLRYNHLRHLPPEFAQLSLLTVLALTGNAWRTPPPEIAARELDDVLNYLRTLQKGSTSRYVAKLLILGEGKTGKSSLLRALRSLPFDEQLATTHGIDIQSYTLSHPADPTLPMILNIWDFGGQQIYHTTHQFFMTQRSLYLLVWNARGDTDQGRLDQWLRNIQVLAPAATVILVATHIDERPVDFNFARFQTTYPQLVGWIGVSNKTGVGIAELCQLLATEAVKLELMEQQWPQTWVAVEAALQSDPRYHIDNDEFARICHEHGVERSSEQSTLGSYLHDLGRILYFQDDDALSDFVVLKPNWLTQTMARVLDDKVTREVNLGVLDHRDFPRLWDQDDVGVRYERRLYPLFHRLLRRFLICYQLENGAEGNEQSLVPLLLPHTPPVDLPAWDMILADQPEIRMVFQLDFVPPGMMSWFIVLTHDYSQHLVWREGVRLRYEGHAADVVLNPSARELWLRVRGPAPWNFFNILQHTLNERIIRQYFTGLKYERKVPCLCHKTTGATEPCAYFFDYDRLVERKQRGRLEVECDRSYIEVSVTELLEGIHYTTNDRIEARLDENIVLTQQLRALITDERYLLLQMQQQNQQMFEQLIRDFARLWNLERQKLGSEIPALFLLMPGGRSSLDPRNLIEHDYTLYLLCQHPVGPHLVKDEPGYTTPRSREWWSTVAPWLRELIRYLQYLPKGSGIVEAYDEQFYKNVRLSIEIFKTTMELAPDLKEDVARQQFHKSAPLNITFDAQGAALRALHAFLKEIDPNEHWCGLKRVITNDGNILWLCPEHAALQGI